MYLIKSPRATFVPGTLPVPAKAARTVCAPSAPPPPKLSGSVGGSGTATCKWVWVPSTNESIAMGGIVNGGSWQWICG